MLVNYAVNNRCDEIILLNHIQREKDAKEENTEGIPFVLRNWSYYGLKTKIEYKAKMNNINLTIK